MDILTIITILIITSAGFSYLNERFLKLPGTIGVITLSVCTSILILLIGKARNIFTESTFNFASNINFSTVLLDIMLGFLLFSSALRLNYNKLKEQSIPVFLLSTVGVLISTLVFGGLFYLAILLLNIHLPLIYCFIFGALISPTDPIAVGAILRKSDINPKLITIIRGESLFNDAVSLVLFVTLYAIAAHPIMSVSISGIAILFAKEVLGGITIGLLLGFFGYKLISSIKDFQTILLLSIALVMGISVTAQSISASIPLAAVTAGLVVGNGNLHKSASTTKFLNRIWALISEVLNTILFVMIGIQLVVMPFLNNYWLLGLISIVLVLISRWVSIILPSLFSIKNIKLNSINLLTWAGLRGGISVAMALSLPKTENSELILSSCYFVVIFSIIVQGLTIKKLIKEDVDTNNI